MSIATIHERSDALLRELQPDGLYGAIAQQLVTPDSRLDSAADVVEAISPKRRHGTPETPRWQRLDNAKEVLGGLATTYANDIMASARRFGTAADETLPQAKLSQVNPELAVLVADGGARVQPIVRPAMLEAIAAMRRMPNSEVCQLGGDRVIDPQFPDGNPNDEHATLRKMAPDFAAEGRQTEYDNAIAVARQDGFEIANRHHATDASGLAVVTSLLSPYRPLRVCVNPTFTGDEDGFRGGLTSIDAMLHANGQDGLAGKQLVVATNGQYVPTREIMINQWRERHGVEFGAEPVVFGDQPGWQTPYRGGMITTANRGPLVYLNEAAVAGRILLGLE